MRASPTLWEELKKHRNVLAHRVNADVQVQDVQAELLEYMAQRHVPEGSTSESDDLQTQYDAIAEAAFLLVLRTLNRLNKNLGT